MFSAAARISASRVASRFATPAALSQPQPLFLLRNFAASVSNHHSTPIFLYVCICTGSNSTLVVNFV